MIDPTPSQITSPATMSPGRLRTFLGRLIEPAASLSETDRPQARLLSYLLILQILLLVFLFPVLVWSVNEFRNSYELVVYVLVTLLLGVCFGLSRTRHHLAAASLTVFVTAAAAWAFALIDRSVPNMIAQDLTFLTVSLVLSSLLLPLTVTIVLSAANMIAVLILLPLLHLILYASPQWDDLLIYLAVVSGLTILVSYRLQRDQVEIRQRSQALFESTAQLQSILDNSNALISLKDARGRYLLVNRVYESLFHKDRARIVGKTAADLFGKEAAGNYRASEEKVLQTGESITLEETATFDDGIHTYIAVKFPLQNAEGKIYAVGTLATDITDYKQVEAALLQSEERFRLVSYATSDAVWDWDFATDQVWWNQSIRRLFGYQASEVRPDSGWWQALIHPEDRAKVVSSLQAAIDGGQEFWSKEFRFRRSNGSYAHVFDRGYVMHDEQGKPVRVLGALMDITQWRQAEEEMEADRNLMRTMIDLLPDNIYVKDMEGRTILANIADARTLGMASPEETVGKTVFDYFPRELAVQVDADDKAVIHLGQKIINREEVHPDKDGNQKWLSTTKVPLLDSGGKIVGLVGIGHDITDRKQIEKALKEANERQSAWIGELERRTKETGLLNEMSDHLQTCPNFEEAYRVIGELARQLFPREAGGLYIINPSRDQADLVASWGPTLGDPPGFHPDDCWGLRMGRLHILDQDKAGNNRSGEALAVRCNHVHSNDPEAYACMPLFGQGEAIGLLHVRRSGELTDTVWFTDAKQELARSMAYRVALALVNLRLRETLRQQSIRDPLTGLFNRRYMEESLEREVHRVIRSRHPLGVMMIDIDHFKDFNDTFGHEAGDAVLRELGALLRSKIRIEDIACRYGGEEFTIILPDASLDVTRKRAEALCTAVRRLAVDHNGRPLGAITMSFGVAAFPDQGQTIEAILHAADEALYRAKKAGRDRVAVAEVVPEKPKKPAAAQGPAARKRRRIG